LDTEPDMFGNDHGDEEGGSFLNCDWGNIADFDDLDRIFRNNGSIFGHEIIGNVDELLSPSTDSINAMVVWESEGTDNIMGHNILYGKRYVTGLVCFWYPANRVGDHGPGLYAVPVLPFMGVPGFPAGNLIPLTYRIPTRSDPAGPVNEETIQEAQQQHGQQRQHVVKRRLQFAFQIDLILILKLAAVVFLFNQEGSRHRFIVLTLFASLIYFLEEDECLVCLFLQILRSYNNIRLGEAVLRGFGLFPQKYWFWIGLGALFGYTILFNILFTIFLTYLNPLGKEHAVMSKAELQERQDKKKIGDDLVLGPAFHSGVNEKERGMALPF
ncbi:hypothetical protein Taro_038444, partial [Colocasia esculenta]|nr:hypothetical protein [Colocasia esculenta]